MKICLNKLFHCKIYLLLFFLIHSFSYSSSYKQFFHQPQKSSNPTIFKPPHISTYITIYPNTPLHFPTDISQHKKKVTKLVQLYSPSPSNLETRRKLQILFLHRIAHPPDEQQRTRSNSASVPFFFFFLVRLKLFLVELVYLTLACQLLSTPFSIVKKKKRKKKGRFHAWTCACECGRRLKIRFSLITSYVPRNFCSYTPRFNPCSRFVDVAPRRGLTGREN